MLKAPPTGTQRRILVIVILVLIIVVTILLLFENIAFPVAFRFS